MAERRDGNGDNNEDKATPGVMGGAAAVGATVGAIVAGPITALALGVGAAGLTLSDGKVIDVWQTQGFPVVGIVCVRSIVFRKQVVVLSSTSFAGSVVFR